MKRIMMLGLLLAAGCGGPDDEMIGKTVIVYSAEPSESNGMVLITDPGNDAGFKDESFIAKFVPSFRAVVLEDMPRVDLGSNDWIDPRWKVRVEDGEFAGVVVAVRQQSVKLTVVK